MVNRFVATVFIIIFLNSIGFPKTDTLTVVSYSLADFPSSSSGDLSPHFDKIFREIRPDVITFQQINNASGVTILEKSLEAGTGQDYETAKFIDGEDSDNTLIYRPDKLALLSQRQIKTALRDISCYELSPTSVVGVGSFFIYSLHLKAGSGKADQSKRRAEMNLLWNDIQTLPPGSNYLICGDFNSQRSTDSAFVDFISFSPNPNREVFDPIMSPGTWNNEQRFAWLHTQSTHETSTGYFASGGMDDRFDILFGSRAILQKPGYFYVDNSYFAYGQDGKHFNLSINDGPNEAVPDSIANALYYASDHLPVVMRIGINPELSEVADQSTKPMEFELFQNYPNPFNSHTIISFNLDKRERIQLNVYNIAGKKIKTLINGLFEGGIHHIPIEIENEPSGVYFYDLISEHYTARKRMLFVK